MKESYLETNKMKCEDCGKPLWSWNERHTFDDCVRYKEKLKLLNKDQLRRRQ